MFYIIIRITSMLFILLLFNIVREFIFYNYLYLEIEFDFYCSLYINKTYLIMIKESRILTSIYKSIQGYIELLVIVLS